MKATLVNKHGVIPRIDESTYKLEFIIKSMFFDNEAYRKSSNDDNDDEIVNEEEFTKIGIKIFKIVDEGGQEKQDCCLEFTKLDGSLLNFVEHFKQLKKQMPYL